MDRLSSVLNRFRPKIKQVQRMQFTEHETPVSFDPKHAYLIYVCSDDVIIDGAEELTLPIQNDSSTQLFDALSFSSFPKGSLIWLASGDTLRLIGDHVSIIVCEYDFGDVALNPFLDTGSRILVLRGEDNIAKTLTPIFTLLMVEIDQHKCGYQVVSERLSEAILVQLLRLLMQQKRLDFGVLAALSDDKLARALVAIHESPDQSWTVDRLAMTAGMSRSAFNTLFRQKVGSPPMEYLTLWRMRLAYQELQNGTKIAELSSQLGYQSETAFRRAFKKVVGKSPGEIQKGASNVWQITMPQNHATKANFEINAPTE